MPHNLELLRAGGDDKGACTLKSASQFRAVIQVFFLFCLLNIALTGDSEMLPQLNVLLLSLELIDLFLYPIDQVLGDGILGHPTLADSYARV